MTDLQVFKNEELGEIRVTSINNEPWFVGKDIASSLGYSRPTDAVRKRVDTEDRGVAKMETLKGTQELVIINESGLYSLILGSKLPSAKKFKRWVTSDVLPTIRKTGGYISKTATPEQLKKLKDNIIELEEENARLDYKLATHLISTKQVSLLGSTINYRAGLAGVARVDLVKKAMVRELRHKFSISAYGDLQEYQFNDAMNFINHYPVIPDSTKLDKLANFGK